MQRWEPARSRFSPGAPQGAACANVNDHKRITQDPPVQFSIEKEAAAILHGQRLTFSAGLSQQVIGRTSELNGSGETEQAINLLVGQA